MSFNWKAFKTEIGAVIKKQIVGTGNSLGPDLNQVRLKNNNKY